MGGPQPPAATPGTYYYSNISYQILAEIIGRAWGNGYEQALRDNIWTPLGMTSAGFGPTTGVGMSHQPNGHSASGGLDRLRSVRQCVGHRIRQGAHEPVRLVQVHVGDLRADAGQSTLRNQAEVRTLTTGVTVIDQPSGLAYGYGWEVYGGAQRIVSHDGSNTYNYSRALPIPMPGWHF